MPALLISSAGSAIIDLTTITSAPRAVYKDGAGPSQSTPLPSTIDQITQQVRAELRDELREELRAEFSTHLQQMRAEMMAFVSQQASVDPNRQVPDASSGHRAFRESAEDENPYTPPPEDQGWRSCVVTTLGRGGSDLTATTIGKALGLQEIQVWKDVDGVLTCDPNIYPLAEPVPHLTFEEAAELAYFGAQVLHPQSMRPAREGDIPVRVKNYYNPKAPGTLITRTRDMSKAVVTSIVVKRNVTMLDIVSTRMLGQFGFLAKVFSSFEDLGISVDVVATSEVSISLTLDPSKLWSRELIQQKLDHVVEELEKIAVVNLLQHRSIISLIGNVQRSSLILEKAFCVLRANGVNVQMISQGASKVKAEQCVRALHSAFFGSDISEVDRECGSQNGSVSILRNGC
ncbi:hypothetical protein ACSBR1_015316 [Camellia fascicularis]